MIYLFACGAALATVIGGIIAMRFNKHLPAILSLASGAILGVAFFELLPESIELLTGHFTLEQTFVVTAIGFLGYLVLDRLIMPHAHHDSHSHAPRGVAGALLFILHSFIDGLVIGFAFQAGSGVGVSVALAILAHDISDGVNTVSMILKNGGSRELAFKILCASALAPVAGAFTASLFQFSMPGIGFMLALFAGAFIYIAASDLIPESYHNHPHKLTTVLTICGVLAMLLVTSLAH
jgi:zinc transporter ZupT